MNKEVNKISCDRYWRTITIIIKHDNKYKENVNLITYSSSRATQIMIFKQTWDTVKSVLTKLKRRLRHK